MPVNSLQHTPAAYQFRFLLLTLPATCHHYLLQPKAMFNDGLFHDVAVLSDHQSIAGNGPLSVDTELDTFRLKCIVDSSMVHANPFNVTRVERRIAFLLFSYRYPVVMQPL